jgi:serine/threonine-protein kinase
MTQDSEGMFSARALVEVAPEATVDGRYAVKRQIARGGIASVFEAEHKTTGATVALKALHRPSLDSSAAHQRLLREARLLGSLKHPNVVAIYDAGRCAQHGPYLVLEMIEGRSLDSIIAARRTLPPEQAVALVADVCIALDALHRRGVVHRDLKPANLFVTPGPARETVKIIDFGIAKVDAEVDTHGQRLTNGNELLGTAEYMSPEHLTRGPSVVDARSDVYALGVVLYECLTGELPYGGTASAITARMVAGERPLPVRAKRSELPALLELVVAKALELKPSSRYASAREFGEACVQAVGKHEPLRLLAAPREDGSTRRRFTRASYVAPIRVVTDKGMVDGQTVDISEGGALLISNVECASDQPVKVRLPLPTSGRVMVLDAVTRWVKSHRSQRTLGVEFAELPAPAREDIGNYVRLMNR